MHYFFGVLFFFFFSLLARSLGCQRERKAIAEVETYNYGGGVRVNAQLNPDNVVRPVDQPVEMVPVPVPEDLARINGRTRRIIEAALIHCEVLQ